MSHNMYSRVSRCIARISVAALRYTTHILLCICRLKHRALLRKCRALLRKYKPLFGVNVLLWISRCSALHVHTQ